MGYEAPTPASAVESTVAMGDGGTTGVNVVTSGQGTNPADAGQGFELVGGARKELIFSGTATGPIASSFFDVSNYAYVSVQIATPGPGGLIIFQSSNDNVNWVAVTLESASPTGGGGGTTNTIGVSGIWSGPVKGRYFRLNQSALTSGASSGTIEFFTSPKATQSVYADTELPTATTPADATAAFGMPAVAAWLQGWNGSSEDRLRSLGNSTDGLGVFNAGVLQVGATISGLTSAATADRLRTPNVFKTAFVLTPAAASNLTLWTPQSGKKFRLMGYEIYVPANSTTSGGALVTLNLNDAGTSIGRAWTIYLPGSVTAGNIADSATGFIPLGNGILSSTANNALQLSIDVAFAAGGVRVNVYGTEE